MTQTQARDVTRALPAWANPRWATDDPAQWAADVADMIDIPAWNSAGRVVAVPLKGGGMAEVDATFADALLALLVSAGG